MSSDFIGNHYLSGRRALTQSALPVNKSIVNVVRIFMNRRRGKYSAVDNESSADGTITMFFLGNHPGNLCGRLRASSLRYFGGHGQTATGCRRTLPEQTKQTGDNPDASFLKESSSQFNEIHTKNGFPFRTLQRYAFNLRLPRFSIPKFAVDMLQERYKRFFSPSQRRYSDVRGTTRFRKSVESDVERNAVNGITRS